MFDEKLDECAAWRMDDVLAPILMVKKDIFKKFYFQEK